ncbi:hypothetical protein J8L88_14620 [Aquimarina sp. MMG015]|uniref:hypothetical protein n=1 Tax=Aquimarina sp. MMG015 TaxID=2822689 RepID=UPI001B3A47B2|nr:hypothetical protein [Aquimarina sp. MMG015]MBQ4804093.1 hypothetical protein [Aquimarina sp. MMG015]
MKKVLRWLYQTMIVLIIVFLLFELSYRFSVIDFYKAEFTSLNGANDIESKDIDYLVFGDSFSATTDNYVEYLRSSSDKTFINSGVQGIGVKQVNTFVNRRIQKYQPKNIIYQVYVGNDLIDVDHLTNYKELPLIRNVYWDVSDMFLSSSYVNYRLGHFKSSVAPINKTFNDQRFSVKDYNQRSKLYFKSDSAYLYKSVTAEGSFQHRYAIWIDELKEFIEGIPTDVQVFIVFVPHCSQLNSFYFNNMRELGAKFSDETEFKKMEYGFFEKASLDIQQYKNVTLLNPLEQLREKDTKEKRLYYLNDPHLNEYGQKVLGTFLEEELLSNE